MGKVYEELDERLQRFILNQKMFFVASAPRSDNGLVNISPKGFDTLRILDSKTVAYLDLTGSGI
ncbi:MAG: pyridoxamine 5'-phosphate oxidase family protein, partial [Pirellulaceae bacterium]|nr:pyridoxamine 5'-phosphate oxidase family protein [Pirellulaceae bacterium]